MYKKYSLVLALSVFIFIGTPLAADPVDVNRESSQVSKYSEIAKNLEIFTSLYRELNNFYVDELDPNTIMESAIDGMLESLDPYTEYISSADIDDYQLQTTGRYGGIGAVITEKNGRVVIRQPYEGSPSQKSGMMAGDEILEIDGLSADNKHSEDIRQLLRGQPNTPVSITVKRAISNDTIQFNFNREEINIGNIPYYAILEGNVAYIKLDQFTEGAAKNVGAALKDLKSKGELKGIILDLRNNPGGLLYEAVELCNLFIDKDLTVVETKGKIEESNKKYNTKNKPLDTTTPLTVMINGRSASASEIVAGVVQDYDRGVVIGQTTFGKGLVQITRPLPYKSRLKVTTYKYYIPSGRCIQSIDYSIKNEDFEGTKTPDSLRQVFYTKMNRPVKDGAGIEPDIAIAPKKYAPITLSLYTKDLYFEYATIYKNKYPEIDTNQVFSISEEDYNDFIGFIEDKNYDYTTKTERMLDDLIKTAKTESYYDGISEALEVLDKNIRHDKNQDLIKHKEEVKAFLEKEIASRYKYIRGAIQVDIKYDNEVEKALEVLSSDEYKGILTVAK
ncbi:MAG TPA: S41 family peptidase [Chitinophagales bacterium]|nr:S41 family peptidase [Chitinophagales bacterium]